MPPHKQQSLLETSLSRNNSERADHTGLFTGGLDHIFFFSHV